MFFIQVIIQVIQISYSDKLLRYVIQTWYLYNLSYRLLGHVINTSCYTSYSDMLFRQVILQVIIQFIQTSYSDKLSRQVIQTSYSDKLFRQVIQTSYSDKLFHKLFRHVINTSYYTSYCTSYSDMLFRQVIFQVIVNLLRQVDIQVIQTSCSRKFFHICYFHKLLKSFRQAIQTILVF